MSGIGVCSNGSDTDCSPKLPRLSTREDVQAYLTGLASELGMKLDDEQLAVELDSRDQLARFRNQFHVPTVGQLTGRTETKSGESDVEDAQDCLYFAGNSLGLQPKCANDLVQGEMDKWAKRAIEGHFAGKFPWYPIEDFVIEESARIVGGKPIEVTIMNTLTVNVHLSMVSFYQPTKDRHKILIENQCFPSDFYAVESQVRWHGYDPATSVIIAKPREGEHVWRTEDIISLIEEQGDSIALVWLPGVHFATGYLFDMKSITEAGHRKGCYVGFDLAHAAGNVELHLHDWGVDVAAWCTYKYLNSGPGSIAGFFVHEKHANNSQLPRLMGWWCHNRETRLKMTNVLDLQPGAAGFQLSNPPVLQCMLLKASLNVFSQTSMAELTTKSRILTGYLELLLETFLSKKSRASENDNYIEVVTSPDPSQRGAQLSIMFSCPIDEVSKAIQARGAACDLREPSLMRVAPAPIYNSFNDVWRLFQLFRQVLK